MSDAALPRPVSPARTAPRAADIAWPLAVACVFALQAALVLTHQPWVDEWQALQIAAQSPTLADLLANLRYEGHPPLWYLVLRAARRVTPAMWTLAAVQLPVAIGLQALILLRAPFARTERLLLATGVFVLFEWGAIARDLPLGVLLTLAVTATRDRRLAWAGIALLPMFGVQFGMLSIALVLLRWQDGDRSRAGLACWAASALLAAASIVPAPDIVPAIDLRPPVEAAALAVLRLGYLLVPVSLRDGVPTWNGTLPPALGLPAGLLFVWLSLRAVATRRLHVAIQAALTLATLAFATFVYPLAPRHLTLLLLSALVLKWRDANRGETLGRGIRAWLILSSTCGLAVAAINLAMPFDTAPQAARAIRARGLQNARWLALPVSNGQGIAAIMGREFETLPGRCSQSFIRWNMPMLGWLTPELTRIERQGRFYILADRPLPIPGLALLTIVPPGYDGARFYLYAMSRGQNAPLPPACAPARRPL